MEKKKRVPDAQTEPLFEDTTGILRPMQGILRSLLERQRSVDILMEHQIPEHMANYPLIIVPEWDHLTPALIQTLLVYANDGGNLLLVGPQAAAPWNAQR